MQRKVLPKRMVSTAPTSAPVGDTVPSEVSRIVGVDLGFVQTKAVWGVREADRCKFGSIVKRRSEVAAEGLEDAEGYLIDDGTRLWNVGSKGTYDFTAERLTHESDMPKLLAVFGVLNQQTAHSFIDLLVSGLPVDEFNTYRDQLQNALTKTFHFGFGTHPAHMQVHKAVIIPQSAGAFYDYALTEDGEVGDSPLLSENVLVLDIGGRTSDGCIMESARYSQDSFTIDQGVWKVQNELRRLIAKTFRYTMHPAEIDSVLRSGVLKLGSDQVDISDLKQKAIETIFPSLRAEISLHVPDFRRFAAVLLAGGGAYLYEEYLSDFARVPVLILPDAEYANASGYRKYGLLLQGDQ